MYLMYVCTKVHWVQPNRIQFGPADTATEVSRQNIITYVLSNTLNTGIYVKYMNCINMSDNHLVCSMYVLSHKISMQLRRLQQTAIVADSQLSS